MGRRRAGRHEGRERFPDRSGRTDRSSAGSREELTRDSLIPAFHDAIDASSLSAALTALLWQPSAAQQSGSARTPIDVAKLGPQVGQLVPDFSLKDQTGKTWTRQSIMGPRGAMLVFFRSADW